MKIYYLFAIVLFSNLFVNAQSEDELVEAAIMNYIDGTSYNHIDQIKEAFYEESNLYLTKDNQLWTVPSEEYISWFEKNEPGTFTGRVGKILSIDRTNDVAMAKAEIAIPEKNWLFIDYFILKKVDNLWKIISKTANGAESNKTGKRILFIVSNAHYYGDSDINTSNHFSEIVSAHEVFEKEGYTIDFVSPEGGAIPIGYLNTSDELQKKYLYNDDFMNSLEKTLAPKDIEPKDYEAVYYCGGGAAMFGVPENKAIQNIAMQIYEQQNGIISTICHGTAGIVHLKDKNGNYLVAGKTVNGFPDIFENKEGKYYQTFPFSIEGIIKERGGDFKYSKEGWDGYMEADGRLITGQDPSGAALVAEKVVEVLKEKNSQ